MKLKWLLFAVFAMIVFAGYGHADCRIVQDSSGKSPTITLENDLVRATFTPDLGGQCTGIAVKTPGGELTDFTSSLFNDLDYTRLTTVDHQVFSNVPNTCEVLKNTPGEVSIVLERRGSEDYSYIVIRKIVTLRDHERIVRVDYEVRNLPESMERKTIHLSLHNWLSPTNHKGTYFWPASNGIVSMVYPAKKDYWNDAPRGWTGVVNDPPSSGIACVMEYKNLQTLYNWIYDPTQATMEWRYLPQDIPSGSSFHTTVYTIPFAGIVRIDHADDLGVYDWEGIPTDAGAASSAALKLVSTRTEPLSFEVRLRSTTQSAGSVLLTKQIDCDPATVASLSINLPALQIGRYVLETQVTGPNGEKDSFEKLFVVGDAPDKAEYTYLPSEKKNAVVEVQHYAPYEVSTEFVTPAVPWFKPYAGGSIKTLFVAPWKLGRYVADLSECISINYHVPALGDLSESGETPPVSATFQADENAYWQAFEQEIEGKTNFEAIVLMMPWKDVPVKAREDLKAMVNKGVGLLVPAGGFQKDDDLGSLIAESHFLVKNTLPGGSFTWRIAADAPRMAASSNTNPISAARLCIYGDPGASQWFEVESYGFCRSLLWVTRHEPSIDASISWPITSQLTRQDFAAHGCPLYVHIADVPADLTAVTVISQKGVASYTQEQKLALQTGDNSCSLPLPLLPSGSYDCQVMLKSQGKVLACAFSTVKLSDAVGIASVSVPTPILALGAPAKGTVVFHNIGSAAVTRAYHLSLIDSFDRTVDELSGKVVIPAATGDISPIKGKPAAIAGAATVDFALRDEYPLSVVHHVVATVQDGDAVVETRVCEVTYPDVNYPADDYLSFTWPSSGGLPRRDLANNELHDYCRFNMQMCCYGENPQPPFQRGFCFGGMGSAYNDWQDAKTRTSRIFSLTDTVVHDGLVKTFIDQSHTYAPYGVFGFDAADESSLGHWESSSELDYSPSSMAGFAIWIKKKYPTLDALNAEWATTYKSWTEVSPMIESEVKDRPNLAPWNDFRDYMEDVWTGMLRDMCKGALTECPKALYGVCGIQDGHPYSGFDMWKIHDFVNMVMPYTNSAVLRSFNPKGRYGLYTGYGIPPDQQIKDSWASFFDDETIYAYFLGTYPVNADLSISHTYADPIRETLLRYQQGIGKLFMDTPTQNDHIAIHYSQSSIRVNYMLKHREKEGNDVLGLYRQDRLDYEALIHDLGYDSSYISYQQVEDGLLTPANYRIFIMPLSTAISAKEAAAIRAYVAAGGIVIADTLPAIYDEHGKPNAGGSLDDLFGIKRTQADRDRLTLVPITPVGATTALQFIRESGISAREAQPLLKLASQTSSGASDSLIYHHSYGKGQTVYLGFISGYARTIPQDKATAAIFRNVFSTCGVSTPPITVTNADGTPALCHVLRHKAAGEQGLAFGLLVRDGLPTPAGPLHVALPRQMHIYDLLTGRYIGLTATFDATLAPGIGQLYAALPSKVTGVAIEAAGSVQRGRLLTAHLQVKTAGAKAETHILRFTATSPSGKEAECYTQNLLATSGACSVKLPFSLDAELGKWLIQVRDVNSGVSNSVAVEVTK